MDHFQEYITVGTFNGSSVEGLALFFSSSRLSEMFNDGATRFLVLDDVTEDTGKKTERIFLNKDMIVWAAPRDVRHSAQTAFPSATDYVEITVHLMNGTVITGKVNLQVFGNIGDLLKYTGSSPFLVLINANDTKGELRHTLFVNKAFIMKIEGGGS